MSSRNRKSSIAQQQKTTKTPIQFLSRNGYGKCFSLIERFEPLKHTPYVYTEISFSPRMGADLYFPVLDKYLKPLLRKTLFIWDQNQTVDNIGIHIIQKVYIEKINKGRFHFVIGDEFTFSKNEVLAVSKWVSYSSEVSLLSFYFLLKNDKEGLLFIRLRLGSANLPEFLFTVTLVVSCNQHKPARLHCGCCEVFERRVMVHWRYAAN